MRRWTRKSELSHKNGALRRLFLVRHQKEETKCEMRNGRWIRTLSNVSECFSPSEEKSFVLFSGEGSRLPIHFQFSINVESRFNILQRDNWISIEADLKLSPVERRDTSRVLFQIPSWMRWRKCQHLRHLPAWGIVKSRLLTCMFRHGAPHESQPNKAHVAMAFPPLDGIKRKIGTEKKSNLDHGWWSLWLFPFATLCAYRRQQGLCDKLQWFLWHVARLHLLHLWLHANSVITKSSIGCVSGKGGRWWDNDSLKQLHESYELCVDIISREEERRDFPDGLKFYHHHLVLIIYVCRILMSPLLRNFDISHHRSQTRLVFPCFIIYLIDELHVLNKTNATK